VSLALARPAGAGDTGAAISLRSCIYEGTVTHRRSAPAHGFTQRIALPLLFLDELPSLGELHPLVDLDPSRARRRPAVMRLLRDDFLPGYPPTLEEAVHAAVRDAGGAVRGPVAMLGHVRTWGWLFNPLTLYYCFDPAGRAVEWTVLEVTNTPWHERCRYVVGPPGVHTFDKAMHVSPFLPPRGTYTLRYGAPGERLRVDLSVRAGRATGSDAAHGDGPTAPGPRPAAHGAPAPEVTASLVLRRHPLDRAGVNRLLWSHAFQTARVSGGIYAQAARLARRGARFHPHPASRRGAGSDAAGRRRPVRAEVAR